MKAWKFLTVVIVALGGAFVSFSGGPYTLDGGNANDYFSGITQTNTSVRVGVSSSTNTLEIDLGSTLNSDTLELGTQSGAGHNAVIVDAASVQVKSNAVIGLSGSDNRLELVDAGTLTADSVTVGMNSGVANNMILVSGSSSHLYTSNTLAIGSLGSSGNALTVTNLGSVSVSNLQVAAGNTLNLNRGGTLTAQALDANQGGFDWNDGSALEVTDALELEQVDGSEKVLLVNGADWDGGTLLTIGGQTNDIFVQAGAKVTSQDTIIGGTSSKDLYVQVTNAHWVANGNFGVDGGVSNWVFILDGTQIFSSTGSVGGLATDRSYVQFSGSNTTWNVTNGLYVGNGGSNSQLRITSGASIITGSGEIGGINSASNYVLIRDAGSQWNITDGALVVDGAGNELEVIAGGLLTVGDAVGSVGQHGVLIASTNGVANLAVTNDATLYSSAVQVGTESDLNGSVELSDGGTLVVGSVYVANTNSALHINRDGTLEVQNNFDVGTEGISWNEGGNLQIRGAQASGFSVTNLGGNYLQVLGGQERTLSLTATSANYGYWNVLRDGFALGVGNSDQHSLILTNGGQVYARSAYIGYGSDSNAVDVSGSGSLLEVSDTLYVGYDSGVGNTVSVYSNGSVVVKNLDVATGNTFSLHETGSLVVDGDFSVGNGLAWESGQLAVLGKFDWAGNLDKTGQVLTLSGEDAHWEKVNALHVGTAGTNNMLKILGGASASNATAVTIGSANGAESNAVVVSGTGSRWDVSNTLMVGNGNNSNNWAEVASGGTAAISNLIINTGNHFYLNEGGELEITGDDFSAADDGFVWDGTLLVSGTIKDVEQTDSAHRALVINGGLLDSETNTLYWGNAGSGNNLVVSNQGVILSENAYIGNSNGANENIISVEGAGSTWTNDGQLVVGHHGAQNELIISTSGSVHSVAGTIGAFSSATGNKVTVKGTNAGWLVDSSLVVGDAGAGNTLQIEQHGLVTNTTTDVGFDANNNRVTVTGSGSKWVNDGLYVGSATLSTNIASKVGNSGRITYTTNIVTQTTSGNAVTVSSGGRVETKMLSVAEGNTFNLNQGGTLHIDADVNVTNDTNALDDRLKWNAGGNLSVGGALKGMATTNLVVGSGTTNTFGYLTRGRYLTLDGTNAVWRNDNLILGYNGDKTMLVVTNGAAVSAGEAFVGWRTDDENKLMVSSAGSVFVSSNNLYLGLYKNQDGELRLGGSDNLLSVSNGGWVIVGEGTPTDFSATEYGVGVASTNGAELIVNHDSQMMTDGGLWVGIDAARTGVVSVTNGSSVTATTLTVADGSQFLIQKKGKLFVKGDYDFATQSNVVWNEDGHLAVGGELTHLDGLLADAQTLSIDGTNAVWNHTNAVMVIGDTGDDNLLNIVNGGSVTNGDAFVGQTSGASKNAVLVSDSNSLWRVAGTLNIGYTNNVDNRVTVANQGVVEVDGLNIADRSYFDLEDSGTLQVNTNFDVNAHEGLVWNAGGNLAVDGTLTGMSTTNLYSGTATYMGEGRHLTLLSNGLWNAGTDDLIVGFSQRDEQLALTNGAAAISRNGYVGWGSGSVNNSVWIEDGGVWTNTGNLFVGAYTNTRGELVYSGSGNNVTVSNNGRVIVGTYTNSLARGIGVGGELTVGKGSLYAYDGLFVDGSSATVNVMRAGSVVGSNLVLSATGQFNLEGELLMTGDLDVDAVGFNWENNGEIFVTNGTFAFSGPLSGTNQMLELDNSEWTHSSDFELSGYQNDISLLNSSRVDSARSVLVEGIDNKILLKGTNTHWLVGGNYELGGSNQLTVADTAQLIVTNDFVLGAGAVFTMASNTTVEVGRDMIVDRAVLSGTGTVLFVTNQTVNNTLKIVGDNTQFSTNIWFDGGLGEDTVKIEDGYLYANNAENEQFINFESLELTNSVFYGSGTFDSFTNITMQGGTIAPSQYLYLDADTLTFTDQPTLQSRIYTATSADELRIRRAMEPDMLDAQIAVADGIENIHQMNAVILNANLGGATTNVFSNVEWFEQYLLYNFELYAPSDNEIAVKSIAAVDGDIGSSMSYAALQGIRSSFYGVQRASFARARQLRRNLLGERLRDQNVSETPATQQGVAGPSRRTWPGARNEIYDVNVWVDHFHGEGKYNELSKNSEDFQLNYYGTTFGIDQLFSEQLILGASYAYTRSDSVTTGDDRVGDETYWLSMYGEWIHEDGWYVDALGAAGWSDYKTSRIEGNYDGTGRFEGRSFGGHVEGGHYFERKRWALAPYSSLEYLRVKTDAHKEYLVEGATDPLQVDGNSVDALMGALGWKLRNRLDTRYGRFQAAGYLEWATDLIGDEVDAKISDGNITVRTDPIDPNGPNLHTGVGISWIPANGVELGVGYDGRFNEHYEEHQGNVSLNIMF